MLHEGMADVDTLDCIMIAETGTIGKAKIHDILTDIRGIRSVTTVRHKVLKGSSGKNEKHHLIIKYNNTTSIDLITIYEQIKAIAGVREFRIRTVNDQPYNHKEAIADFKNAHSELGYAQAKREKIIYDPKAKVPSHFQTEAMLRTFIKKLLT